MSTITPGWPSTLNSPIRSNAPAGATGEPQDRRPKMVAFGESLTSGMQGICLDQRNQDHGALKLLANQMGIAFNQPQVSEPGTPPPLFVNGKLCLDTVALRLPAMIAATDFAIKAHGLFGSLVDVDRITSHMPVGHRIDDPSLEQHNFAVPGFRVEEYDTVATDKQYFQLRKNEGGGSIAFMLPMIRSILQRDTPQNLGTMVDQAIKTQPDIVFFWGGSSEALTACDGEVNDYTMTPMDDKRIVWDDSTGHHETPEVRKGFRSSMEHVVLRLLTETKADVFIMDNADLTLTPFMRPLGQKLGPLPFRVIIGGHDVTETMENHVLSNKIKGPGQDGRTHFPDGSMVDLNHLRGNMRLMSKIIDGLHHDEALFSENDVVDPDKIARIQEEVRQENAVIQDLADRYPRVHRVPAGQLVEKASHGLPLIGNGPPTQVSTIFAGTVDDQGRHGIMSPDGLHMADGGQQVLANFLLDFLQGTVGDKWPCIRNAVKGDEIAALYKDPTLQHSKYTGAAIPSQYQAATAG